LSAFMRPRVSVSAVDYRFVHDACERGSWVTVEKFGGSAKGRSELVRVRHLR
jgi:hypothetical protein